jgi:DNA-binding MarR family transcriptional regulator
METVESDQLAVAHALERLIAWLRQSREPSGLSASALSALGRLESHGSLRVTELADIEQLTQPGTTTLINRLVEAGLAVREPDPDDGRAVRVTITAEGRSRVASHRDARAALIETRLLQLGPDDQAKLRAALPAIRAFADARPQSRKKGTDS